MKPFRVCMLGAFDSDYPRHQIIISGLQRVGVEVVGIILPRKSSTLRQMPRVAAHWRQIRACDAVFVPAFNQLLAPSIWLLGSMLRRPVIADYMVGLVDAVVEERNTTTKTTIYRAVDRFNTRRMMTVTDTEAHRRAFTRLLGGSLADLGKMAVLPVGAFDTWFSPQPPPNEDKGILVQFFGSYIPFHGVDVVLEAAAQFRDDPQVRFELIGRGQTYKEALKQAQTLNLSNVAFVDMIPPASLPARVAQASICLGVFGAREKTDYVVPNKVYQCMAIGRPVITAESAALNEFFTPGEHLVTVTPGSADALAAAIRKLIDAKDERLRLGTAAAARIREAFLPQHIGAQLKQIMQGTLAQ